MVMDLRKANHSRAHIAVAQLKKTKMGLGAPQDVLDCHPHRARCGCRSAYHGLWTAQLAKGIGRLPGAAEQFPYPHLQCPLVRAARLCSSWSRERHVELFIGIGCPSTMKDEDASRIASSLERIAPGLDQLNELLHRKALEWVFETF